MKKGLSLIILTLALVGCDKYEDQVNTLNQRISDLEAQVATSNNSTIALLETGRCTLTDIQEDSALLECGDGTSFLIESGKDGKDGTSCSVTSTSSGAQVNCTDGTMAMITHGQNGSNGQNGTSCSVQELALGAQVTCEDGSGAFISNGQNGSSCQVEQTSNGARLVCSDGTIAYVNNGKDGSNGQDGMSCKVTEVKDVGALVECGEGEERTSAMIYNGQNGRNGISQVIEYIDPCGDNGRFDEIILKMADGTLIAHYAGGGNTQFLTIIGPGNYQTTDGYKCNFSVTNDLQIISKK